MKRRCGIQNLRVAGDVHVVAYRKWKPQQIVRAPGANTCSGRQMPPMLHVSFDELPRSSAQNHLARDIRRRIDKCQRILQLVTKPISAARLIQSGTSPDAAAQRLVEQPAIHQEIDGKHRRLDLNRGQESIPPTPRGRESLFNVCCVAGNAKSTAGHARHRRPVQAQITIVFSSPGPSSNFVCSAAHGSSPGPVRLESDLRRRAAGAAGEPLRPRNSAAIAGI